MPSPEHRGDDRSPIPPEARDHDPYYCAARFAGEEPAGRAYFNIQDLLYQRPDTDLSTYRFHLNRIWHVAVLGEPPPSDLDETLRALLSTGEPVELPPTMLAFLMQRRAQATQLAPWLERHYRQGKPLD